MHIHELKREHPLKKKRQIGRGGKRGKTAGRGTKGQKARAGGKLRPELRDIIKKLPKQRGYKFNRIPGSHVSVVNVSTLDTSFASGDTVTRDTLIEKKIVRRVSGKIPAIKILGTGTLTKKLTIKGLTISESAKIKVEKAGGSLAE